MSESIETLTYVGIQKGGIIMSRLLWILVISIVLVIGCSPGGGAKNEDEPENEAETTWTRNPPSIHIGEPNDPEASFAQFTAIVDKFCYETDADDPCNLSPIDPQEVIENEDPIRKPSFVTPGEEIIFNYYPARDHPPHPDEITITQFRSNEDSGVEVEIFGEDDNKIQAPDEEGKYFYRIHMEWTGEFIGEAYYTFHYFVKEEDN